MLGVYACFRLGVHFPEGLGMMQGQLSEVHVSTNGGPWTDGVWRWWEVGVVDGENEHTSTLY